MTLPSRDPFAPYRGRRALVLGSAGFVGRWVARLLTAAGAQLTLVVRNQSFATPIFRRYSIKGRLLHADLAEPADVARAVRASRPWVTFNLAGYGVDPLERDESTAFALNRDLVSHLCDALPSRESGTTLVHVGSALEYGRAQGDLHEDTPAQPDTIYGISKLAGTRALATARASGAVNGLTARLFMVYGPGEHPTRLLPTILAARKGTGRIALTEGHQMRDFSHVADVARAVLLLGLEARHAPPIVNVARGHLTPVRDFVSTAARVAGIAPNRLGFGDLPGRTEEMAHAPVNVERLRTLTGGWAPDTSIEDGVRSTIDFLATDQEELAPR